ncbi:hypothetical protein [Zoogloea sp. 1C4]|uniref:hypothetical protein n=1 Tax=Zoogloea sp. 1C4 TaxID=2570190 RepID=UPI0018854FFB|nr:hypothetical protein [Zoogloea sp. 1C4]
MKLRLLLPPLLPRPPRLPPPLMPSPLKLLPPLPLRLLMPSPLKLLLPLPLRPPLAPPPKTPLLLPLPTPKRSNLFAVEKKPTCGLAFFTPVASPRTILKRKQAPKQNAGHCRRFACGAQEPIYFS